MLELWSQSDSLEVFVPSNASHDCSFSPQTVIRRPPEDGYSGISNFERGFSVLIFPKSCDDRRWRLYFPKWKLIRKNYEEVASDFLSDPVLVGLLRLTGDGGSIAGSPLFSLHGLRLGRHVIRFENANEVTPIAPPTRLTGADRL